MPALHHATVRRAASRRLRSPRIAARVAAWLALIAIAWPSLGPAPWLARAAVVEMLASAPGHLHAGARHADDARAHDRRADDAHAHNGPAGDAQAHGHDGPAGDAQAHGHGHPAGAHTHGGAGHVDAADLPGSPTHPIDHECFQCEVLKHLAQSVPAVPRVPVLLPPPQRDIAMPVPPARNAAAHGTTLPPATGPPPPIANVA